MGTRFFRRTTTAALFVVGSLVLTLPLSAQLSKNMQDWMQRLNSGEFSGGRGGRGGGRGGRGGGGIRWVEGGKGYVTMERGAGGSELVRYDTATEARTVLMTSKELTPPDPSVRLSGQYTETADGKHMLFAGTTHIVMIRKNAGDYWVLDRTDNSWRKLGGTLTGGLLYAKLSPDGSHAAYIHDNNIYVEDVRSGAQKKLTDDGTDNIINGTSDWVYEEEFGLRDAFEWSPDGTKVAYLQFNQTDVPEFALINYTDTLYPVITKYHYPKPGQLNSLVKVGVVSASGGPTTWMKTTGDPKDSYIARMDWAGNSDQLILEHLNRLQNTNDVLLADIKTGDVKTMFEDKSTTWVNIMPNFTWLEHGQRLLFESERDGWRHAYAVSRDRRRAQNHDRQFRSDVGGRLRRSRRLAVLYGFARQRHRAISVSLPAGRQRAERTRHSNQRARLALVQHFAGLPLCVP